MRSRLHRHTFDKPVWEPWFAWYPVVIEDYDTDGVLRHQTVWFETIERLFLWRRDNGSIEWNYRIPGVTHINDSGEYLYAPWRKDHRLPSEYLYPPWQESQTKLPGSNVSPPTQKPIPPSSPPGEW